MSGLFIKLLLSRSFVVKIVDLTGAPDLAFGTFLFRSVFSIFFSKVRIQGHVLCSLLLCLLVKTKVKMLAELSLEEAS